MRAGPRHRRVMYMFRAYLIFHAKKIDQTERETTSWAYLMEWARLGGKKDEVING